MALIDALVAEVGKQGRGFTEPSPHALDEMDRLQECHLSERKVLDLRCVTREELRESSSLPRKDNG